MKSTHFRNNKPSSQELKHDETGTEYLRGMLHSLIEGNPEIHDFIENMTKEEEQIMSKRVSDEIQSILEEHLQNKKAARLDKQDGDAPKDSSTTPYGL